MVRRGKRSLRFIPVGLLLVDRAVIIAKRRPEICRRTLARFLLSHDPQFIDHCQVALMERAALLRALNQSRESSGEGPYASALAEGGAWTLEHVLEGLRKINGSPLLDVEPRGITYPNG